MRLYNTLTKKIDGLEPLNPPKVSIYSCGPTVYNRAHIGNLISYIYADTLRRAIKLAGYEPEQVINYTDVDDKTIRRSREEKPNKEPLEALHELTDQYIDIFLEDVKKVAIDTQAIKFMRATDNISEMQNMITDLYKKGFAYIADDGVYFSITNYQAAGYKYGKLVEIARLGSAAKHRIDNDEYDKEEAMDFALWKKQKDSEPAWDFQLGEINIKGRPGWHIECSAMSCKALGQPFDIHTGGIDLIFPHHENEIAQSTAGKDNSLMAQFFVHSEHLLIDGKKMAKSAGNFYTLQDIIDKGFEPLAFRLLVLQSHYRSQAHFTWENLENAQNRLRAYRAFADLRFQSIANGNFETFENDYTVYKDSIKNALQDDLKTPQALVFIDKLADERHDGLDEDEVSEFVEFVSFLDDALGLRLLSSQDITHEQKQLITNREKARSNKDWATADDIRKDLESQNIGLRDTDNGTIWFRTA